MFIPANQKSPFEIEVLVKKGSKVLTLKGKYGRTIKEAEAHLKRFGFQVVKSQESSSINIVEEDLIVLNCSNVRRRIWNVTIIS